jgi:chemotaxis protein MotB
VFSQSKNSSDNNFWISYADLMAGLLFVFILLIGAIISKSIILKNDLADTNDILARNQAILSEKDEFLKKKRAELQLRENEIERLKQLLSKETHTKVKLNNQITTVQGQLDTERKSVKLKESELKKLQQLLAKEGITQENLNKEIAKMQALLDSKTKSFKLKDDEIKRLKQLLARENASKDKLNKEIRVVQNLLTEKSKSLETTRKSLKEHTGKVYVLSNQVNDLNKTVKLKTDKVLELLTALDSKKTDYDQLIANLRKQKAQIKALTGIRLQVIAALKDELGKNIGIDKQSGSLRLASNVIFDTGKAELKEGTKANLKKAFEEYVGTLVSNQRIKPHIDKIIIEGHTDSDGDYLYNLELSQKRALAVLNYITTLEFTHKHNIKPLLIASGRGYLDTIKVNGVEDKEASRRIEIKFRLKNDDAMLEIEKILDAK